MKNSEVPSSEAMSTKFIVVPLTSMEKSGNLNGGNPEATCPVIPNGIDPLYVLSRKANSVPKMTTIALRERAMYLHVTGHFFKVPIFWKIRLHY